MTFWGVLLALAWDQMAPLFRPCQLERLYGRYADWVHEHVNAGTRAHGGLAWAAAALVPALVAGLVGLWLSDLVPLLGLAWAAAVLYRCLGFRQMVDLARGIAEALTAGELERARERLAALGGTCAPDAQAEAVVQAAVDRLFRLGLERLFGVLFWFILLGPFGAVAYTLTTLLSPRWRGDSDFHAAVGQILPLLDWAPARLAVFSFAIVGNFEEAMVAWRLRVSGQDPYNEGVVKAAGLGALGLDGEPVEPEYVAGVASLYRRALLLWLGVLGLFWLGGL